MTAILGLDVGERRIGVAIADVDGFSARPLVTVLRHAPAADARALAELIRRHEVIELVVGMPYEAAGQEGTQAARTRDWVADVAPALAEELGATPPPPIVFRDERLSSHLAEDRLGPMPRGRSGGPPTKINGTRIVGASDREAAAIILQDELDARRAPHATPPRPRPSTETSA